MVRYLRAVLIICCALIRHLHMLELLTKQWTNIVTKVVFFIIWLSSGDWTGKQGSEVRHNSVAPVFTSTTEILLTTWHHFNYSPRKSDVVMQIEVRCCYLSCTGMCMFLLKTWKSNLKVNGSAKHRFSEMFDRQEYIATLLDPCFKGSIETIILLSGTIDHWEDGLMKKCSRLGHLLLVELPGQIKI